MIKRHIKLNPSVYVHKKDEVYIHREYASSDNDKYLFSNKKQIKSFYTLYII